MKKIVVTAFISTIVTMLLMGYVYMEQKQKRRNEINQLVTEANKQLLEMSKKKY